jgi:hypothetical protein
MPKRNKTELDNDLYDLNVEYIVEKILKTRMRNGKKECLIKWQSFSSKFNTWEPEENVRNIEEPPVTKKKAKKNPFDENDNRVHYKIPEKKLFDNFDNQFTSNVEQYTETEENVSLKLNHTISMKILSTAIESIKNIIDNTQIVSKCEF